MDFKTLAENLNWHEGKLKELYGDTRGYSHLRVSTDKRLKPQEKIQVLLAHLDITNMIEWMIPQLKNIQHVHKKAEISIPILNSLNWSMVKNWSEKRIQDLESEIWDESHRVVGEEEDGESGCTLQAVAYALWALRADSPTAAISAISNAALYAAMVQVSINGIKSETEMITTSAEWKKYRREQVKDLMNFIKRIQGNLDKKFITIHKRQQKVLTRK